MPVFWLYFPTEHLAFRDTYGRNYSQVRALTRYLGFGSKTAQQEEQEK
jgi:hypothetical protein